MVDYYFTSVRMTIIKTQNKRRGDGLVVKSPYCPCPELGSILSTHVVAHNCNQYQGN